MKIKIFTHVFYAFELIIMCGNAYAFEKKYTHPALSQEAANNSQVGTYLQSQLGYAAGLNTQLQITNITTPFIQDEIDNGMDSSVTTRSILGWTREGSKLEDAQIWQARSQHHFYDPIRNAGLNNRTDHPDWEGIPTIASPFDLRGESALFWIITGTSSTGYPKNNLETWTGTQNKFYNAITSNIATDRGQYLAETFIALGHILHMLEDMGVPAHTRNDFLFAHYRSAFDNVWGNPLETWAENQVKANSGNIPSSWLTGWTPQAKVFDKISKYWDTDSNTSQYIGPPSSTWGLAEQTNYQFLSTSTVFGCSGTLYQFPQPARENVEPNLLLPTPLGYKIYFNGSSYGVQHLARESYTYYFADGMGIYGEEIDSTITPDDVNVYQDYVRVTIPRTIDYASGLINYFFRGKLSVDANCSCAECSPIELYITNQSVNTTVNQTLKGGSFELYWDDNIGNRTPVSGLTVYDSNDPNRTVLWGATTTLPKGNSIRARFNKPLSLNITKYILVYRGSISANPSDPDPNDPNAIAVCTFDPLGPPQPHITNITPEMGCPGSILFIEGRGFSKTPSHNTVLFDDVNTSHPNVYGTVTEADSNGRWLKVELPYFDAEDEDFYWVNTTVTADGNTSDPYTFKLTNYVWCTITLWDAGEDIDDEFDLYINSEYLLTSYLAPPEDPTVTDVGFWYEDVYDYVDVYLYESYGISGGTLGITIEPYVDRVTAYRWNSSSQSQEFLYDEDFSGTFTDYFGSDILVEPDDGVEMDVYTILTYTGSMALTEMAPITIPKEKSAVVSTGRILERQGQFDPARVAENKRRSNVPRKRTEKITDHHRTRDKVKSRTNNP